MQTCQIQRSTWEMLCTWTSFPARWVVGCFEKRISAYKSGAIPAKLHSTTSRSTIPDLGACHGLSSCTPGLWFLFYPINSWFHIRLNNSWIREPSNQIHPTLKNRKKFLAIFWQICPCSMAHSRAGSSHSKPTSKANDCRRSCCSNTDDCTSDSHDSLTFLPPTPTVEAPSLKRKGKLSRILFLNYLEEDDRSSKRSRCGRDVLRLLSVWNLVS